jgi:hypothetical protein
MLVFLEKDITLFFYNSEFHIISSAQPRTESISDYSAVLYLGELMALQILVSLAKNRY